MAQVMFRTLAMTNGVRVLPVHDREVGITYEHYVTTTSKGRTVIGPVKHVASKLRKKTKDKEFMALAAAEQNRHLKRLAQGQDFATKLWQQEDKVVAEAPRINLADAIRGVGMFTPPLPAPRRNLRDRLRDKAWAVRDNFLDTEVHKAIQHAAVDVISWSVAAVAVTFAVKVILWAL